MSYYTDVNAWLNLRGYESEPDWVIDDLRAAGEVPEPDSPELIEARWEWSPPLSPDEYHFQITGIGPVLSAPATLFQSNGNGPGAELNTLIDRIQALLEQAIKDDPDIQEDMMRLGVRLIDWSCSFINPDRLSGGAQ